MECELLRSPMISYRSLLYNTTVLYDIYIYICVCVCVCISYNPLRGLILLLLHETKAEPRSSNGL